MTSGQFEFFVFNFFSLYFCISFVMILLNWSFFSLSNSCYCCCSIVCFWASCFSCLVFQSVSLKKDNRQQNKWEERKEKSFRLSFLFCTFRFPEQGHKVVNHLGCAAAAAAPTSGQEFAVVITTTVNWIVRLPYHTKYTTTTHTDLPFLLFLSFFFLFLVFRAISKLSTFAFFQSLFLVKTEPRNVRKLFFCAEYTGGECSVCVFTHHLTRHDLSISISVCCCCCCFTFSSFSSFSSLF